MTLLSKIFQLDSIGRNREANHIDSGTLIRFTTESNSPVEVSRIVSWILLHASSFKSGVVVEALSFIFEDCSGDEEDNIYLSIK